MVGSSGLSGNWDKNVPTDPRVRGDVSMVKQSIV